MVQIHLVERAADPTQCLLIQSTKSPFELFSLPFFDTIVIIGLIFIVPPRGRHETANVVVSIEVFGTVELRVFVLMAVPRTGEDEYVKNTKHVKNPKAEKYSNKTAKGEMVPSGRSGSTLPSLCRPPL